MSSSSSRRSSSPSKTARTPQEVTRHDRQTLLEAVINLADDDELCDVTFLVGKGEEGKEIRANSTVLALRSEYFRAMCFGPMRSSSQKVIPDMSPKTFERVLCFIHAKELDWLPKCFVDELWELRYAAAQFLLPDLEELCETLLEGRLTWRNALLCLKKATMYRCDEFRRKALRVLKNRHMRILKSEEICGLEECDFIEIMKLYDHVRTDHIINAAFLWGKNKTQDEFKETFWNRLFPHIRWDNLSNEQMLEIHKIKLLPIELENEAMLKIIGRSGPLPKEEDDTVCEIEIKVPVKFNVGNPRVLQSVLLRTMIAFKPGCIKPSPTSTWVEMEGHNMLKKTLESREMTAMTLDHEDIFLFFDVNRSGLTAAKIFSAEAFHVKVDNRDVFFFSVKFDPVRLSEDDGKAEEKADDVFLRVKFPPDTLKDLQEFLIPANGRTVKKLRQMVDSHESVRQSSSSSSPTSSPTIRSWQSTSGSANEGGARDTIGSAADQLKYFFEGLGLPVFVAFG